MLITDLSLNRLKNKLSTAEAFPYQSPVFPDPQESAVLIVLHEWQNCWHLLVTKRSENLTAHPGQISFPGGRRESTDNDLMTTALRETEEEVGIPAQMLEVIAELTPVVTLTGYKIQPYVAYITELPALSLQQEEVDQAFHIPLGWCIDTKNITIDERKIRGNTLKTFRLDWNEHVIWGATAMMITELAFRLRDSEPFKIAGDTVQRQQ